MTAAIGASAAAILLILAASAQAQEPAGTNPATGAVATPPVRDTRPAPDAELPKVDPKLLFDVINALTRPRPAPPPGATAPAPTEPAPTPPPPATEPTEPKPAAIAVPPAPKIPPPVVVPRAAPTAPATPPPEPSAVRPAPPAAVDEPLPAEIAPAASPPAIAAAPPAATEPAASKPVLEPADAFPGTIGWLLLALIPASAVAATSLGVQRARRIARTKAALSLEPRLDMSAGIGSTKGLALAGPSVAIRTRLDWIGAR